MKISTKLNVIHSRCCVTVRSLFLVGFFLFLAPIAATAEEGGMGAVFSNSEDIQVVESSEEANFVIFLSNESRVVRAADVDISVNGKGFLAGVVLTNEPVTIFLKCKDGYFSGSTITASVPNMELKQSFVVPTVKISAVRVDLDLGLERIKAIIDNGEVELLTAKPTAVFRAAQDVQALKSF